MHPGSHGTAARRRSPVVRVETLREQAEHALYRLLLGIAVDLQDFVIINRSSVGHACAPCLWQASSAVASIMLNDWRPRPSHVDSAGASSPGARVKYRSA